MSPRFPLFALLVAVAAQSCFFTSCFGGTTIGPTTCGTSFPSGILPTPDPEPVQAVGQPVSVVVKWDPGYSCTGAPTTANPTGVTLEVTDPNNRVIEAAASEPVKKSGQYGAEVWETTVTFTPAAVGAYHVIATFEPGLSLVQRDAWVVNDRRTEAAAVTIGNMNCNHLERTTLGAVLCQHGGGVTLFRNDTQVATWGSDAVAHTAGNVIWVQGGTSSLTRSVDNGTGPPVQTASVSASIGAEVFAVTESDALTWDNDALKLYHFNGSTTFDTDAEVKVSLSVTPRAVAFSREGGSLAVSDWKAWSRFDLPLGQSSPTPDWTDNETAAFQSPEGLWVAIDASTFRFIPADKRQPMATLVAPAGWQNSLDVITTLQPGERPLLFPVTSKTASDGYSTNRTIDKSVVLVPKVTGAAIVLTAFQAPPGAAFVEVTQGQLRAVKSLESFLWPLTP